MTIAEGLRSLSLHTIVRASPEQVSCDVASETVLLSMTDGQYYGLNEVGASIWRLIQEPRTALEVRDALLREYNDIDADECEHAVLTFLSEMLAINLVERT